MKAENPREKAASLPMPEKSKVEKPSRLGLPSYIGSMELRQGLHAIADTVNRQAVVLEQLQTVEKDRLDQHRRTQEQQQAMGLQQVQMLQSSPFGLSSLYRSEPSSLNQPGAFQRPPKEQISYGRIPDSDISGLHPMA